MVDKDPITVPPLTGVVLRQFGLTDGSKWLPRDAYKRSIGLRYELPDLWQDEERCEELAKQYGMKMVAFDVSYDMA